jgi:iron(III) transport system permease protein
MSHVASSPVELRPPTLLRPQNSGTRALLPLIAWLVAALALLPLLYLLIRAAGSSADILPILLRPRTLTVFLNSIALAAAVTATAVLLGVSLAWLTVRTDLPARPFWAVITCLPLVLPSYVGAFTLIAALGPRGMLSTFLQGLGIDQLPSFYGFGGAWLALSLFTYPYVLLSVRAGLRGLDPSLENAARCLGRTAWQTFLHITLPHLRPAVAAGALLVALYTLSDFGAVALLQFNAFTREIYIQYTGAIDRTAAAVLALFLVVLTIVILTLEQRARGRTRYHRAGTGTARRPPIARLGRWRWPALIYCALIAFLALGVPVLVTLYWLLQRVTLTGRWLQLLNGTLNSVTASGLAALGCVLAALPVVLYIVRRPGRPARWVERSIYLSHALPGIVVALALVFIGSRYALPLYQTLLMLVTAYILLFLPLAVGTLRATLISLSPRLEEAARSLGRTSRQCVTEITLPLLRPGLLTGMALVFLSCMKELPATLLLGPTGFHTLATRIWGATEEALFARAAAPALLLVLISSVSLWIILRQEEARS